MTEKPPPDEAETRVSAERHLPVEEPKPAHQRIGPYRILDVLGEGGMGTVYVAEQKEPVRRRVALKVIKLGMDSKEVLNRFEAERQALAMMEHDNIARVYEAGLTDTGQPYFSMEYVKGAPINKFCDQHKLGLEERIDLFRRVCAGVQHAHQKGVIHRDLTPRNILVTVQEGKPSPKVIDFGIARATDHRLVESTIFTEQGRIIGTPEYMSPEQAGLGTLDIDTRSDVYTLGVLLYELLVGSLPFSSEELRSQGLREMERKIREQDPPKPSTRLSTPGRSAPVAGHKHVDPKSLARRLKGDLDWITMKAMEKDRTRRYQTPTALADDLQRYLQHEPVLAGPPSAGYRAKKFLRRYRSQVATAALVFFSLVVGMILFAVENQRANRNAELAQTNEERANREAADANAARDEAQATAAAEQLARRDEAEARADAEAALSKFNLLSNFVILEDAIDAEPDLFPAWPENAEPMSRWLVEQAEPLVRKLPELRASLQEMRDRATEPTTEEIEAWRRAHPLFDQLTAQRRKLAALMHAHEVRNGEVRPRAFPVDAAAVSDLDGLNARAWQLVTWDESEREWGREAEGLALARLAWNRAKGETDGNLRARIADTVAWALHANGLDDDAIAMSEAALAAVPAQGQRDYQDNLRRLRNSVAASREGGGTDAVARRIRGLEDTTGERRAWRFEDPAEQFLHDALADLVAGVGGFVDPDSGLLAPVREGLRWARSVEDLSITAYASRWTDARRAILRADGKVGSDRYAQHPIELEPQMGLVPIGMNPATGLWEFYHLHSAVDPSEIPEHDEAGEIRVTPDTGMVFVLIPGGSFLMGSQSGDPAGPAYDASRAENDPYPQTVEVAPFFLSRYEMTQAQWVRLSGDDNPSTYKAGESSGVQGAVVTGAHPLETVPWTRSRELLHRHGLQLPEESQWEYAARAGTGSLWHSGDEVASLEGSANVLDTLAKSVVGAAWQGSVAPFSDGHVVHAPVGSFAANAFGLHDAHGNVREWCEDPFPGQAGYSINRGGCFNDGAARAKSAYRNGNVSTVSASNLGMRPARAIH